LSSSSEYYTTCSFLEIHETIKRFHDEHPGGHFSPLDKYQLIPEKIDLLYGAYTKEGELEKSVEEPSFEVLKTPLVPKKSKEQYFLEYPDLEDDDLPVSSPKNSTVKK
jgi:hypothetical protein